MELFIYLLKVSGCTAVFYLMYYTLLRKLTFFSLNRWYILISLASSLAIPAVHIGVQTLIPAPDVRPVTINTSTKTITDTPEPIILQQPQHHIDWLLMATYAYWLITALLLLRLTITLYNIFYKAIKYGENHCGYRIVNIHSANNSSFFNYIFLNDQDLNATEKEQVIAHELIHVQQFHSADKLFAQVLKAVLWFNPFIYLFAKALYQVHEFEVDRRLTLNYNSQNYAGLLLKLSLPAKMGLSNQFSAYGLKARIGMLFGKPSATVKKLIYLLAIPVLTGLVYLLCVEKVYAYDESNPNFVLVLDPGHGGKSGAVANGIMEKDLTLSMAMQIKAIAVQRGIKTILTRNTDKEVSLSDRLIPQGDVFVSIHVNSAPFKGGELHNGIAFLINKNENYPQSKKLAGAVMNQLKLLHGITTADTIADNQHIKVLRDNRSPALLVELGYLTNKSDLNYITNKQNQHDMAEKFIDAILAYKQSAQQKMSGATRQHNYGLKVGVAVSFSNKKGSGALHTIKDTAVKTASSGVAHHANNTNFHATKMTIAYIQDDKNDIKNLYEEFKDIKYTATDSTRYDIPNKILYLHIANVTTPNLRIKANFIKINKTDSTLLASGKVNVWIMDQKKPNNITTMDLDTLSIDMKLHFKKKKAIND